MAKMNILYLSKAHPLWNSELRFQVTNIVDAKLAEYDEHGNELETFGRAELDEARGWVVVAVETDMKPKDIINGYWLDIIDDEADAQLLPLADEDKNSAIIERARLFDEAYIEAKKSLSIDELIKAVVQGKTVTIDGKPITGMEPV